MHISVMERQNSDLIALPGRAEARVGQTIIDPGRRPVIRRCTGVRQPPPHVVPPSIPEQKCKSELCSLGCFQHISCPKTLSVYIIISLHCLVLGGPKLGRTQAIRLSLPHPSIVCRGVHAHMCACACVHARVCMGPTYDPTSPHIHIYVSQPCDHRLIGQGRCGHYTRVYTY
jgi:hypothetical protein